MVCGGPSLFENEGNEGGSSILLKITFAKIIKKMFTWIANLNVTDWKPPKKCTAFFLHCTTLPLEIESAKKEERASSFVPFMPLCWFIKLLLLFLVFILFLDENRRFSQLWNRFKLRYRN